MRIAAVQVKKSRVAANNRLHPHLKEANLMSVSTAPDDLSGNRASASASPVEPVAASRPRLWPAVLILTLFWTFVFVARQMELITFVRFISSMAASGLVVLSYAIW
jgi:hypothetical protein